MSFKFNNNRIQKPKRVVILGSSGIISGNLQKLLKEKNINVFTIGKAKFDLRNKNTAQALSSKIRTTDSVVFISAEAPVKNIRMFINNLKICNTVCDSLEKKKN